MNSHPSHLRITAAAPFRKSSTVRIDHARYIGTIRDGACSIVIGNRIVNWGKPTEYRRMASEVFSLETSSMTTDKSQCDCDGKDLA